MPLKYHIPIKSVPSRFYPVPKNILLESEENCLHCARCVKELCPYDAYGQRYIDPISGFDTINNLCKDCFRCVQGCIQGTISKVPNPEYQDLGDSYWTPQIISTTWYQAETGRIPVSGAGYGGPFRGPGFDAIWTDMSEIVRPTRDGIHGREYISTTISLGRKPLFLSLDEQGQMAMPTFPRLELPLPVLLSQPMLATDKPAVRLAIIKAARVLGTVVLLPRDQLPGNWLDQALYLVPQYPARALDLDDPCLGQVQAVELDDYPEVTTAIERLKGRYPEVIVSIKLAADAGLASRCEVLAGAGAEVLHISADDHAQGQGAAQDQHLKDLIRQVHLHLVETALRDGVTLIASGGVALAEHVAKAIICGVDGVAVDLPLMIALECRLCHRCLQGQSCPVDLEHLDPERGAQRLINLMGAWNNQLLEVLGAMGIREVRRLRGEIGRAMFFEELERETFAPLFALGTGQESTERRDS
ncbi:MAG: glutamate synthase-related protein [Desulfobacca sp.]|nr:glutamate synthase-related protein [Desulfobacca sp.]